MIRILFLLILFACSSYFECAQYLPDSTKLPAKQRVIRFGTMLEPVEQMQKSRQFAKQISKPGWKQWQAKGDKHKKYFFSEADHPGMAPIVLPDVFDFFDKCSRK